MSAATGAASDTKTASSERDESELERLDRNTVELLNELRVASTGIQVLFAFLLVVPFNTGFSKLSSFDRYLYFVTLLCIAVAAALLIAPSIHHRLLFRQKPKVSRKREFVARAAATGEPGARPRGAPATTARGVARSG